MTTFCRVVALSRTCRTVPLKVRPWYASTVKVTTMPARILPTSASATLVSTCMRVRSSATVKSVGVWSEAATVCPTSTLREITVPLMGEMIVVYLRLSSAWSRAALDWAMLATPAAQSAVVAPRLASAVS